MLLNRRVNNQEYELIFNELCLGNGLEDRGILVRFLGKRFYSPPKCPEALEPTQVSIQWVQSFFPCG